MNDLIEKLSNLRSQFNCFNENEREAYHTLSEAIKVISERKTGKWIHGREVCREYMGITLITVQYDHWECSVCGYRTENEPIWNFCPNCSADMMGEQNEPDKQTD